MIKVEPLATGKLFGLVNKVNESFFKGGDYVGDRSVWLCPFENDAGEDEGIAEDVLELDCGLGVGKAERCTGYVSKR